MRACCLVLLLPGCDLVFGTASERPDADVPRDSAPDVVDAMPIDAPLDAVLACPAGYTPSGTQGTYRAVVTASVTFKAAEDDCADDLPGATHLAVPNSQNELNVIHLKDSMFNVWVGVTDVKSEGSFRSITTDAIAYPAPGMWASGQPDGGTGSNCAAVQANGVMGVLQDDPCTDLHHYICECDGMFVDSTTVP